MYSSVITQVLQEEVTKKGLYYAPDLQVEAVVLLVEILQKIVVVLEL